MRKIVVGLLVVSIGFLSCAKKEPKPQKLNYSLLDEIYNKPDKEVKKIVQNLVERDGKILNVPKYIKVYRGSFKDNDGNVVTGGFEFIKVDNGEPNTNF